MLQDKEYFENLINSRKYWDLYSSEFHSIETDQKLLNVAEYLNLGGNLHYLISVYKRNKRIDIRNAVSQSIKFFLEKLANDDKVLLRGYSETQLITILSRELKNRRFNDYNVNLHKSEPKISFGSLNLDLNIQEDKETLFYDNPWLDLVNEIVDNSYKPLNENIHIEDQKYIDEFNSSATEEYNYHLEILPEPFWGNVLNSEIAILTLNPGYVKQKNTDEYEGLSENEKIEFVKDQCKSMSLQSSEFIPTNSNRNSISDYYWDKKTKELRSKYKDANSKIALIQYIGYTSYKFKDLPRKITEKIYHLEEGILYTQKFTVRLVEYLIQQKKVIIIARNENLWYKAVKGLKGYENLITLDNYRNTYITPNNCKKSGKWYLIENALTKQNPCP
jgi:hypothetical protein